jgi:hypothetical protein
MTTFEILSLVISGVTLLALLIGLLYGAGQLRCANRSLDASSKSLDESKCIHQQNHDFGRRHAAQDALRAYDYSVLSGSLNEAFKFLQMKEPVPLVDIQSAIKEKEGIQRDLHQLLNFYEGLARGINQGIFDEKVIKAARKNAMIVAERGFQNYINKRRTDMNPRAWSELSSICSRWQAADNHVPPREKTGT